ncbi:MAG: hypothetical protein AVDCRST_MAG93-7073 [uncultured Chloroflexia bacterium]|uniref:Uncharacterized protein n=1 Tax=uncultured Chloroflexia bacterium TaxID=1672391 RepID=A0A6J4M4J0_9CHLR|nr:MAG: hypothetical protein AVDCRST_MAG93-7073 [uncultured Chloroflexia bacterium]
MFGMLQWEWTVCLPPQRSFLRVSCANEAKHRLLHCTDASLRLT